MQLGATVWSDGSWREVDSDLRAAEKSADKLPMCFNSYSRVSGSFAVIFHRNTFQEVIDWLDHGPVQPFDWVFGWLAVKGYTTRVAYPFVVIPDITIESDVDNNRGDLQHNMKARAETHRWHLEEFSHLS